MPEDSAINNDESGYLEVTEGLLSADIEIEEKAWQNSRDLESLIRQVLTKISDNIFQPWTLSVLLSHDRRIRKLNRDFRGKDYPTNVLSFPSDEDDNTYLGDIAIAYETLQRECAEQEKPFDDHFRHLLLHGILHLLGYDHETDEDAEEMENLEINILEDIGIKNPYT